MVMMTWLADVLRASGLRVEETDGWKQRGRGEMGEVRGILCHHTGGPLHGDRPSLTTVLDGRDDLPGPLSQLFLTRAGTFVVVAAGRCNHAGAGNWQGVTTGNSSFIGIEAENAGVAADEWPYVQLDAYVRGCAAILRHLNADDVWVAGHREYALPRGRKIDPLFDMVDFRVHVQSAMNTQALGGTTSKAPMMVVGIKPAEPSRLMLRKGDQGQSVKQLQLALNAWLVFSGHDKVTPVQAADGAFGPHTEWLVQSFQHDAGLAEDGMVGPKTWAALSRVDIASPAHHQV